MNMACLARRILLASLLFLCGCYPTYAPPVRVPHGGAPGRLGAGQIEVGADAATEPGFHRISGGPRVSAGLTDGLTLELGGESGRWIRGDRDEAFLWALGFGGIKVTPLRKMMLGVELVLDIEAGAGLGRGGELYGNSENPDAEVLVDGYDPDGLSSAERFAWGGYAGVGFATRWEVISLFVRTRYQLTGASNVPPTHWISLSLGPEVAVLKRLFVYVAATTGRASNKADEIGFTVIEFGARILL